MEINVLRSFAAVVQYGSFTKAAEQLYISQPTVSTHVRALEEQLGCPLILRSTKNIEITPKGKEVSQYVNSILELWDRVEDTCRESEKNIIHLGASTTPSAYILPDLLPEFAKNYPHVYFVIHQGNSQNIFDGLKAGLFDMGLVGSRPEDAILESELFFEDHMVLITPVTDYYLQLKSRPETSLETLLQEPVILRAEGSGAEKNATRYLGKLHVKENSLNVVARVNDQETVKNLVTGGLGISLISAKAAESFVREKRLLQFELPDASSHKYYLVWRKDMVPAGNIETFRSFIRLKYRGTLS